MSNYHVPVLLDECIAGLAIKPSGVYVDVTFGGGGHTRAILSKLGKNGKVVAFDQDEDAKQNLPDDNRLVFIDQNFRYISNHLQYQELYPVDGLLADLGVSSHQFDEDQRGFSFRFPDAALDMRMSQSGQTAADLLNTATESKLADIFYYYGELRQAKQMAKKIVAYRSIKSFATIAHLKDALIDFAPKFKDYKYWAQVFQALRIEVNNELDVLRSLLNQCSDVIKPGGRLVVMSYHSLEDRLVKNFMQTGNTEGVQHKDFYGNVLRPFEPVSKKAITASADEIEKNPRARSAKLRIAERVADPL